MIQFFGYNNMLCVNVFFVRVSMKMIYYSIFFISFQIFFFKALHKKGSVNLSSKDITDYAWVTQAEMGSLVGKTQKKSINKFIFNV